MGDKLLLKLNIYATPIANNVVRTKCAKNLGMRVKRPEKVEK